jgi:hypothetical protein
MSKITIFRTVGFFGSSQPGAPAYLANSKQSIGGYWASATSKAIGTGMTPTEIQIVLPLVIDVEATDRDFRKEVKAFYEGLETKVDYTRGVELNTDLHDDTKPLSKDNLPNEPMDYIRYKHALGHPEVALSLEASKGNSIKKFYVHEPGVVKDLKAGLRKRKDEAMQAYINITGKPEKVDNVLALLGKDPRSFKDDSEKLEFLQGRATSIVLEELDTFITTVADKQLETKGFIQKLVTTGVFKTIGTRYMVTETGTIVGNDLEETILELEDEEKNSQLIVSLKAKLQDEMKKKISAGKPAKAK